MIYQDNVIESNKTKLRENWNKDGDLGTLGQTYWINFLETKPAATGKENLQV
jgi:hypothetical protein